jgi:hypothetical protein
MLESASSIHTFALRNCEFDRFGTSVTMCVGLPAIVAAPSAVTVNLLRGEFRNWSAGSTEPAVLMLYGIRITWPGTLLGRYAHNVDPSATTRSPLSNVMLSRFGFLRRITPLVVCVLPVSGLVSVWRNSARMLLRRAYAATARSINASALCARA